MGMLVASFRVPYRGMPIIACYQFQAAKLRFFPETTKYFFFFLRNILEKSVIRRVSSYDRRCCSVRRCCPLGVPADLQSAVKKGSTSLSRICNPQP